MLTPSDFPNKAPGYLLPPVLPWLYALRCATAKAGCTRDFSVPFTYMRLPPRILGGGKRERERKSCSSFAAVVAGNRHRSGHEFSGYGGRDETMGARWVRRGTRRTDGRTYVRTYVLTQTRNCLRVETVGKNGCVARRERCYARTLGAWREGRIYARACLDGLITSNRAACARDQRSRGRKHRKLRPDYIADNATDLPAFRGLNVSIVDSEREREREEGRGGKLADGWI